jgi:hypothetical protein
VVHTDLDEVDHRRHAEVNLHIRPEQARVADRQRVVDADVTVDLRDGIPELHDGDARRLAHVVDVFKPLLPQQRGNNLHQLRACAANPRQA